MENQIQKTSWSDLPQEILGIIFGKLLEDPANLIRGRAVCKNWRISRDRIRCKDRLPSLCNISGACNILPGPEDRPHHIERTIFDPYERRDFKKLKPAQEHECVNYRASKVYGSKQGWLIVGALGENGGNSMFMYNLHSEEIIPLPLLERWYPCFATFQGNPLSHDCQVFVFCGSYCHYHIARYCFTVDDKEWKFSFLETTQSECRGMQYMNEQLYCLFDNGSLKRYSLADGSWTLISLNSLKIDYSNQKLYLIKGEDNVLLACKIGYNKISYNDVCSTFYFDWSSMCWVEKDLPESSAIFICCKTAMIRRNGNGENAKDCRVYYFAKRLDCRCKCYSFTQKSLIETHEFDWIIKLHYEGMAFAVNIQEYNLDICFQ